jgi:hypothetical protein
MQNDDGGSQQEQITEASRKGLRALVGALSVGVLGSAMYEFVFRPGLSVFGKTCLSLVTLGSSAVRDSVYADATFDPTGLASLEVLKIFCAAYIMAMLVLSIAAHRSAKRLLNREAAKAQGATFVQLLVSDATAGWIWRHPRALARVMIAGNLLMAIAVATQITMKSESMHIWRVFHRDLAVIVAVTSNEEANAFRSRFARMRKRQEYVSLRGDMMACAKRRGLALEPLSTW